MNSVRGLVFLLALGLPVFSQNVQVNRQNKTIAISADATVSVDSDVAVLHFGYENYGRTRELVLGDNLKVADQILKALTDLGVRTEQIEGSTVAFQAVTPEEEWTQEQKKRMEVQSSAILDTSSSS